MNKKIEKRYAILEKLCMPLTYNSKNLIDKIVNSKYSDGNIFLNDNLYATSTDINVFYEYLTTEISQYDILEQIKMYKNAYTGQGEFLFDFLFDSVVVNGGSVSYDLTINNKNFEVKCYNKCVLKHDNSTGIRLGVEGVVTNFNGYMKILDLISVVKKLLMLDNNILESINKQFKVQNNDFISKLYEYFIHIPPNGSYSISTGFNSGEINKKLLLTFNCFIDFLLEAAQKYNNIINNNIGKIIFNKQEYLFEIDDKNIDISNKNMIFNRIMHINDVNNTTLVIHYLDELMNFINTNNCCNLYNNFTSEAEEYLLSRFNEHPMIIINNVKAHPLCLGIYTNFKVSTISQRVLKIKPAKL